MTRGLLNWYKAVVVILVLGTIGAVGAKTMKQPLVRIAELEIDPGQLPAYRDALKEEIASSIRVEPGVLKLYAVSVKDQPSQISRSALANRFEEQSQSKIRQRSRQSVMGSVGSSLVTPFRGLRETRGARFSLPPAVSRH